MILYNIASICLSSIICKVPMSAPNNSREITVHIRLTRNEHYASFSQAWLGILTGRLGKFPGYSYPPILHRVLGLVAESSPVQLDRSISDVPLMPCLERVSEWLVPVYPSSTQAYEMFSSKLTRCFSQLECPYV